MRVGIVALRVSRPCCLETRPRPRAAAMVPSGSARKRGTICEGERAMSYCTSEWMMCRWRCSRRSTKRGNRKLEQRHLIKPKSRKERNAIIYVVHKSCFLTSYIADSVSSTIMALFLRPISLNSATYSKNMKHVLCSTNRLNSRIDLIHHILAIVCVPWLACLFHDLQEH